MQRNGVLSGDTKMAFCLNIAKDPATDTESEPLSVSRYGS